MIFLILSSVKGGPEMAYGRPLYQYPGRRQRQRRLHLRRPPYRSIFCIFSNCKSKLHFHIFISMWRD